jgi:hypothetical protein
VLRIELAHLVDHARMLLFGVRGDCRHLRGRQLRGLVGRDLVCPGCSTRPSTPACCVGEDCPNNRPTMSPNGGAPRSIVTRSS